MVNYVVQKDGHGYVIQKFMDGKAAHYASPWYETYTLAKRDAIKIEKKENGVEQMQKNLDVYIYEDTDDKVCAVIFRNENLKNVVIGLEKNEFIFGSDFVYMAKTGFEHSEEYSNSDYNGLSMSAAAKHLELNSTLIATITNGHCTIFPDKMQAIGKKLFELEESKNLEQTEPKTWETWSDKIQRRKAELDGESDTYTKDNAETPRAPLASSGGGMSFEAKREVLNSALNK